MIFLTVGTLFPFDRLVKAVDDALDEDLTDKEVLAQIGRRGYRPHNMEYVEIMEKGSFSSYFQKASFIISHAGIGTIAMAFKYGKPLLVMPRLKRYREHVNDHQVDTARKFEELGHILAVYDVKDLPDGIHKLKNFVPKERKASPEAVADRIRSFLNSLQAKC